MLGLADDLAFADSRPAPRLEAFRTARRLARESSASLSTGRGRAAWRLETRRLRPLGPRLAALRVGLYRGRRAGRCTDPPARDTHGRARPALGRGRCAPPGAAPGVWKPDPDEFAAFVRAAARRFSGFYPDPKGPGDGLTTPGASLPQVRGWQLWDEPNRTSSLRPASPAQYRRLLNAGAAAVRQVSDENLVVAGGTAAAGALGFWRRLLCRGLRACTAPARFDVLAHQPVRGGGPIVHGPLVQLARALRHAGRLRARIWLTDLGWDTPPLAPGGVTPHRAARNLRISLRRAAAVPEVRLVVWEGLQDRPTYLPDRFPTVASGLYELSEDVRSARPKPALRVFRGFLP